ncbi:MAG: hypothetical protein ABI002_06165 [Saprospiraceae bacterium]
MRKNEVYLNAKQIEFLRAPQKDKTFMGARGTGKSTEIGACTSQQAAYMPRAKIFFSSSTYGQLQTKTIPAMEVIWNQVGLKEYKSAKEPGHYRIGQRPPPGWANAFQEPRRYENIISFFNGFRIELLSMDRPDLARGGSYDGGHIDEIALVDEKDYGKVLRPMIRGNRHRFTHYMHQQICKYTSIPWLKKGQWLFKFEELAKAEPDKYLWLESNIWDNVGVLGEDYIRNLELELSYLEFQVECMNQRIRKVEDGFYNKFSEERNLYAPNYQYDDYTERGIAVTGTDDVWADQFIEASFDFSGWFNCATIMQERDNVEKVKKQFYRKADGKINELVDDICKHFKSNIVKYVRVWGEPRGHDRNAAGESFFVQVKARFELNGWACEIRAEGGRTTSHLERYHFMNELLSGENPNLPKVLINEEECKDVIIAIQITDVNADFSKNKSKEKDRDFPQEHAPHFPDTLDYYFVQKHGYKYFDVKQSSRPGSFHFG